MDSKRDMTDKMLFDILLCLPVISLLRFKSMCKSWFSLIDSSTFITQHLNHHSDKDALIASYRNDIYIGHHFCLLSGHKYEVYTDVDFDVQWHKTIGVDIYPSIDLIDSCDGIVCLYNKWSGDVALWNPALKQLRPLPKSSFPKQRLEFNYEVEDENTHIGFGFDEKANDYKVVRIIQHELMHVNQVEVYNLRTFSWRAVHQIGAFPFIFAHAASKNGTCFWFGRNNHGDVLVSFDLKNEVFGTISLPTNKPFRSLAFLDDKLVHINSLTNSPYDNGNNSYEIWMLHESGVKESWNKVYQIGPLLNELCPVSVSKNGVFILLKKHHWSSCIDELHLYNLVTREEPCPPIQEPNPCYLKSYLHYNESLVSIKNVNSGT